jgi:hypothetical protein
VILTLLFLSGRRHGDPKCYPNVCLAEKWFEESQEKSVATRRLVITETCKLTIARSALSISSNSRVCNWSIQMPTGGSIVLAILSCPSLSKSQGHTAIEIGGLF